MKKTVAYDFAMTLGSRIAILTTSLGVQSCLAWFLGPSGRGSYAICLLFAGWLSIVFILGCDSASTYFVASKKFSISEGFTSILIFGGISSIVAVTVGLILMQLPLSLFDKALSISFYLSLATIPTTLFSRAFIHLLTAVDNFSAFAIISMIHGACYLALTILFVWLFSWGVNGALLANLAVGLLTMLCMIIYLRLKYTIRLVNPSVTKLMDMLKYGAKYYIGKISNRVNFQIGTLVLALFATTADVGIFAVASALAAQIMIIPDTLSRVLMPRVAQDVKGERELVAQSSRITGFICGIILVFLALFATPIITLLFSKSFLAAVPIIQILAVGMIARCSCKVFVPYLLGTNNPWIASISVMMGMLVNIVAMYLLLPLMGLNGAALAVTIGYFVSSTILVASFTRLSGYSMKKTLLYRKSDMLVIGKSVKKIFNKLNNHGVC